MLGIVARTLEPEDGLIPKGGWSTKEDQSSVNVVVPEEEEVRPEPKKCQRRLTFMLFSEPA